MRFAKRPDFEVAGVVRRNPAGEQPAELAGYKVVSDVLELDDVQVAILCTPTREVEKHARILLAEGINTVDSYDIHGGIADLRKTLDPIAKAHGSVAIISAGWDPGSDSGRARTHAGCRSEGCDLYQFRTGG